MTGAILAGGMSRRMGFNKAFLKISGETIIERTVKLFKDVFDETVIVANEVQLYENLSTRIVTDIYKGAGSIGGIYTALFHCPEAEGFVFVAACDMPCLDKEAIKAVAKKADKRFDAIIPFVSGRFHPMHGLYSKRCMKTIESMIRQNDLKISGLLEKLRVKKLTEEDLKGVPIASSVENINTKEDLARLTGVSINNNI